MFAPKKLAAKFFGWSGPPEKIKNGHFDIFFGPSFVIMSGFVLCDRLWIIYSESGTLFGDTKLGIFGKSYLHNLYSS